MIMESYCLHYNTVTPLLKTILATLITEPLFSPFRLVGGTNLSLRLGHRRSIDIDLFTDAQYDSLDFRSFEKYLKYNFTYYCNTDPTSIVGLGRGYFIGRTKDECIKLDLMYTEEFLNEAEIIDGIRMASLEDIAAMKIDAISRGGRKKDFWDVHKLLEIFSLEEMLEFHKKRQPWEHDPNQIFDALIDFNEANLMEDPICLEGKDWDEIKLSFIELVTDMAPERYNRKM